MSPTSPIRLISLIRVRLECVCRIPPQLVGDMMYLHRDSIDCTMDNNDLHALLHIYELCMTLP